MLVDLKVKKGHKWENDTLLVTHDGKTYSPIPMRKYIGHLEKRVATLEKKVETQEKAMVRLEERVDSKLDRFISVFKKKKRG